MNYLDEAWLTERANELEKTGSDIREAVEELRAVTGSAAQLGPAVRSALEEVEVLRGLIGAESGAIDSRVHDGVQRIDTAVREALAKGSGPIEHLLERLDATDDALRRLEGKQVEISTKLEQAEHLLSTTTEKVEVLERTQALANDRQCALEAQVAEADKRQLEVTAELQRLDAHQQTVAQGVTMLEERWNSLKEEIAALQGELGRLAPAARSSSAFQRWYRGASPIARVFGGKR